MTCYYASYKQIKFQFTGYLRFDLTVLTIHTRPEQRPQEEINGLQPFINYIINAPGCYSGNAIIMGDFNQGVRYVKPATSQSSLDMSQHFDELTYIGGSTRALKPPQKHDRLLFNVSCMR